LAQEVVSFVLKQGPNSWVITPLAKAQAAAAFYNYSNDQSNTGLELAKHSLLFLYRDTTAVPEVLSLFVIHSAPASGVPGSASLTFKGLPAGVLLVVRDDANDTYTGFTIPPATTPPAPVVEAKASWTWLGEHSDGLVLSNFPEEFEIIIEPNFTAGIEVWEILTGSLENPERISLSLTEPVTIIARKGPPPRAPVACFTFTPSEPIINALVTFDASCSTPNGGELVKYEWDFGDGTKASGRIVTHAYATAGRYTVTLTVTDSEGLSSTTNKPRPPLPEFITVIEVPAIATREISTPVAFPGSTFRIRVEIQMLADVYGLGLDENLPPGWEITLIDTAGATFKRAETQWVFPETIRAGELRRIVYDVTVPKGAELVTGPLPASLKITGFIDSASPPFKAPVGGETELEVNSCLPIPVAIAHLVLETNLVDLRLPEEITHAQMRKAVDFWREDKEVPATCGATIPLDVLKNLIARQLMTIPVDEPLPEIPKTAATASRLILTPLPFHQVFLRADGGNIFRVSVEIRALEDLNGLGLAESFPFNWEVKPIENAGADFKLSTRQWVFAEKLLAKEAEQKPRVIVYEVTVPTDEAIGVFKLKGTIDSAWPRFTSEVVGESELEVVECLSIPVAIAHLDVAQNIIDVSLSNKITFEQIQAAIAFWLEDEPVPGTCGKTIDFATLKVLLAYWLTDTPVDKPLPMGMLQKP